MMELTTMMMVEKEGRAEGQQSRRGRQAKWQQSPKGRAKWQQRPKERRAKTTRTIMMMRMMRRRMQIEKERRAEGNKSWLRKLLLNLLVAARASEARSLEWW